VNEEGDKKEPGPIDTDRVRINGKEMVISEMKMKDLSETQRCALLSFQNKLLEKQWLQK
jgi:hypothetical protein